MKWLSDVSDMADGKFGIEWENADGYRWWETFETVSKRQVALDEYAREREANAADYEAMERQWEKDELERLYEYYSDADYIHYLTNWDLMRVTNYIANGFSHS